ncbi:MAG: tRNA (adenosine(37)-N6)-threonylcarbamoyltransferase complex dimerization subunit type 1 TsaB [Elusimicrobiota bacterium]|jgi:tRNA threonylcarbamoyladenosine biosynthesis protein TsaB|nr:tRNA (adenosine(37)-N6)-threonylcarbamoyltransferase complex dimerization subunit type 1 TsaB [Elusimicrobiota bacterium]
MKILSAETSGQAFSVAINENGSTIASFFYNKSLKSSELLIPTIENLLKTTQNTYQSIDLFAVSTGPGSFTGIRVALTVIKTLAQCLNKPIAATDSLTVLESSLFGIKGIKVVAAIDALRDEIYLKDKAGGISICTVKHFCSKHKRDKNKILIVGSAAIAYKDIFLSELGAFSVSLPAYFHFPTASTLASAAHLIKPIHWSKIKPLYIRRSWAEETRLKGK